MKALVAILSLSACLSGQALKKIAAIDLPGPKGQRFDYLTVDEDDHYLLSAHLGPGILYVIDLRTNALVKAIPGVPGITGRGIARRLSVEQSCGCGSRKEVSLRLDSAEFTQPLLIGHRSSPGVQAESTFEKSVAIVGEKGSAR